MQRNKHIEFNSERLYTFLVSIWKTSMFFFYVNSFINVVQDYE